MDERELWENKQLWESRGLRETRNCGREWRIVGKNGMVGNARNCGRVGDCESD